ncbi:MAG TPA: NUDIX domain-containing protein [Chloroflexia bacterium]|nr:NUDIX domain-containing protein [Chloroflexia bacterium]
MQRSSHSNEEQANPELQSAEFKLIKPAAHLSYVSSGGLIFDHNQFLLLKRRETSEWQIPKGHVEAGENFEDTALREVIEETGYNDLLLAADLGIQFNIFTRKGQRVEREEHCFLLRLARKEARQESVVLRRRRNQAPDDKQIFEAIWVPFEEVVELLTFETEKEFARRALAELKKH